jgi:hypothetical protein
MAPWANDCAVVWINRDYEGIAEQVDVVQDLNSIALAAERLEIDLLGCWI